MTNSTYTGRVKWFNRKAGYGFIVDTNTDHEEIFVYYSDIVTSQEQYKYLVDGEYVSFELKEINEEESKHKVQAVEVKGINGGKLMCETQLEKRNNKPKPKRRNNNVRVYKNGDKKVVMRRVVSYVPVKEKTTKE